MDKKLLLRRQLLWYFGLGVVGTVGAGLATTALRYSLPRTTSSASNTATTRTAPIPEAVSPIPVASKTIPDFQGISQWLNSAPLTIADLKGSVVLVQFWTFACINCQRTLPYITRWHQQYAASGLKVIGIHTPEFAYERDANNIKLALKKHQITYPVPIDNEYKTWKAYENEYWPHLFLADRQGFLHYDRIGEGAYEETEQTIRKLLG